MTPAEVQRAAARAERRLALAHELASRALIEEPSRLWPALAQALLAFFGCERATIFGSDAKGRLVSRYAHGMAGEPLVVPAGQGLVGLAAATGRPMVANDAQHDGRVRLLDGSFLARELLALPLMHRGRAVGVVELLNKDGGFTDADLDDAQWLSTGLALIFVKAAAEEAQVELARRIAQVEKMAALGRMAAGLAHEVNNPLTAILGLTQVVMRRPDTSEESLATLLKVDAEVRRIQTLVTELLGFSRGGPQAESKVELAALAAETLELAAPELKRRRAHAELAMPAGLPPALGDAHALKQVLLNLLLNAAHAVGERGGRIWLSAALRAGRLEVCLADDGPGVPAELADKIFEPFFTTKPEGQGTGLGLYVSAEIVRRHGGRLVCEPRPGGGAAFRFDLKPA